MSGHHEHMSRYVVLVLFYSAVAVMVLVLTALLLSVESAAAA